MVEEDPLSFCVPHRVLTGLHVGQLGRDCVSEVINETFTLTKMVLREPVITMATDMMINIVLGPIVAPAPAKALTF